jgi:signal recognition particle GTPase
LNAAAAVLTLGIKGSWRTTTPRTLSDFMYSESSDVEVATCDEKIK